MNIKFFFVFLWFFLMTLNSYYFYNIGMALFSVLSAVLSIPLLIFYNVTIKNYHKLPLRILLFFTVLSLLTALPNAEYIYLVRIPLMVLYVPLIIFSSFIIFEKKELLLKVIKFSILIHLIFFFVQFISFYGFGHFIDYLEPITGEAQRAFGGNYEINSSVRLIRVTGLFNEPGTYSTFLILMLAIKKQLESKIFSIDKLKLIDLITIFSVLLTFSVFGFIFSLIFLLKFFSREKVFKKILLFIVSLPFVYFVYNNYIMVRFQKDASQSGISFRQETIDFYFNQVFDEPFHLLFGYSSFIDLNGVFNKVLIWNDVSFIFTLMVYTGIIGVFLFLMITIPRIKENLLIILFLCLCKLSITTIFIWFCITYIYMPIRKEKII